MTDCLPSGFSSVHFQCCCVPLYTALLRMQVVKMLPTTTDRLPRDHTPVHDGKITFTDADKQVQPYPAQSLAETSSMYDEENDADSLPTNPGFLDWASFDEATLPPRRNARRSRLDRILSPLKSVSAGLPGSVSVEGLGGVIESAHGVFHSVRRLDFMESERIIYLMREDAAPSSSSLPRRELERYENELFDLSKYDGACGYLTAMTWAEETLAGSITLFQVLFGDAGETVGIRPVAAMRDVPSPVLAKMRADDRIKRKAVLTSMDEDDRTLKWRVNPGQGPRYVRVSRGNWPTPHLGSPSRSHRKQQGLGLAEGNGVCATIPQFVALLHARRTLVEGVKSTRISPATIEDSETQPTVSLFRSPVSNPHEGSGVHVAVLVPNDALWAKEEIIWTDEAGLPEFRQRQYWQLVERARSRRRNESRSRSRMRDVDHDGPARSRQRSVSQARGRSGSRDQW